MATIFDIAKKAGVSITTVSRALNGYSDVNEKTRKRVMQIADELNYYPNAAARSLQGKKTNTIAFAPRLREHSEAEPFFKEFIGILAMACLEHDLSLLVTVADKPENTTELYRELAGTGRVDGIILSDIKPNDERVPLLQELGVPFAIFGRTMDYNRLEYPFVDVDGTTGIDQVVRYLHQQGHRRIAYVNGLFKTSCALHRYDGYLQGLKGCGMNQDVQLVIGGLENETEVKQAIFKLLDLPEQEQPTAIIASNDWLALNVLHALEERGVSVGRKEGQMALTGFDDLPFATYLNPALTTMRQPLEAVCQNLLKLLGLGNQTNKVVNAPADTPGQIWLGPKQVLLHPELVVRDSA